VVGANPPPSAHANNGRHIGIPWLNGLFTPDDQDDNGDVLDLLGDNDVNTPVTSGSDSTSWDPGDNDKQ
jgi:hypothetical protein